MNPFEMRGRLIVQSMWTELEKIALAEEGAPEPMEEDPDKTEKVDPEEESGSPISGILGTKVVQKGSRARGIPVFNPPDGYQFRPDLQAFAPSEDDAWMSNDRAVGGEATRNAYSQGQQDEQQTAASNEMRRNVDQSVAQMQQEQAALQQQPPQQPPPRQAAQAQPPAAPPPQPPQVNVPGKKAVRSPKVPSARLT